MIKSVLFVCLGNICRSPTAEAVFRKKAEEQGLDLVIDSAGTGSWHIGEPPHPPSVKAGESRGYELSHLRARQISRSDFDDFDLIIALDQKNQKDIERVRPAGNDTPVELFLDYAQDAGRKDMPDPYFTKQFDLVLELCEAASDGLVGKLKSE